MDIEIQFATVREIKDADQVLSVWMHDPVMWDQISGGVTPDKITIPMGEDAAHLGVWIEDKLAGVISFYRYLRSTWSSHIALLPPARAKHGLEAGRAAMTSMKICWDAKKLITHIPSNNRAAQHYARQLGFQREGESVNAWEDSEGNLHNIVYYGVNL